MQQSKKKKQHAVLQLFEKFISESRRGKRLQPNGKKISPGTIKNYLCTLNLLKQFCSSKGFELRLREERYLNCRETEVEKHYWKKFYKRFTDYLYSDLGYFDNYIGATVKNIKTFFNYLNRESSIRPGNFHRQFYVRKEEIVIFPLMPEELNFLIYNQEFEESLSSKMREVKDVFVFGCTVALRVSDLLVLKRSSLRISNDQYYLSVRSQKTGTDTQVRLPSYCIEIINRYKRNKKHKDLLLPKFSSSNLNQYIKQLLEVAGFTHEVSVTRDRRGKAVHLRNTKANTRTYRFCDVASTHTMRRTAITTMLCLGMPEQIVRKISGHAPGTKEFYRYVLWAQAYQDQETEIMYEKLKQRQFKVAQY